MKFDSIHFYVEDARASRDWFIQQLNFQARGGISNQQTRTEIVGRGQVDFLLSSPIHPASPVAEFLHVHPPGVIDVGFQVDNLELTLNQALEQGAKVQGSVQAETLENCQVKWATLVGWGGLNHTLTEVKSRIESEVQQRAKSTELMRSPTQSRSALKRRQIQANSWGFNPSMFNPSNRSSRPHRKSSASKVSALQSSAAQTLAIDHVVLNVESGDLAAAVQWYQTALGFQSQQNFTIQTDRSGLHSQVLTHSQENIRFPINEPISPHSQIQDFLDHNQGSGIQHIALRTNNLIQIVQELRANHLPFLAIPDTYYDQLQAQGIDQKLGQDWEAIRACQILVDWQVTHPEAILLQIFTQPIFDAPTFFFEFIERRSVWYQGQKIQAEGFGERNFQALYEAVEQEQLNRTLNNLQPD
ncbi:MAG: 4-hydroxyphenylpyruvate dioxygenase [Oscillatoriales cyanobacterium RM2_1_1]|nr:4-hydroxyphenylpyruvate dioxygenase [Oscillatoriales cyanobacterium SM2_3_0]NJO46886.1 4-hydroxyphenylpyruvate dioxygenase [Oscillatoriales cyanobacterium RM2_1_1]